MCQLHEAWIKLSGVIWWLSFRLNTRLTVDWALNTRNQSLPFSTTLLTPRTPPSVLSVNCMGGSSAHNRSVQIQVLSSFQKWKSPFFPFQAWTLAFFAGRKKKTNNGTPICVASNQPCKVARIKCHARSRRNRKPPGLTSSAFLAPQDAVFLQPTSQKEGRDEAIFFSQCFARIQFKFCSLYLKPI